MNHEHESAQPSPWITGWLGRLPVGLSVIDVASGSGRHALWAQSQGYKVTAIDREEAAVAALRKRHIEALVVDLESDDTGALNRLLAQRQFDVMMVTNYLWRPRWDLLLAWLKPDGLLLYETFALGHERYGRPSRPDFLLEPGELFHWARRQGLRVVGYEDGLVQNRAGPACVQRMAAIGAQRRIERLPLAP